MCVLYYIQKLSLSFRDQILSMKFMRKYIHIAKVLKPVLTEEASEVISEEYSRLRSQDFIESDVARVIEKIVNLDK